MEKRKGRFLFFLILMLLWWVFTLEIDFINTGMGMIICGIITLVTFNIFYNGEELPLHSIGIRTLIKFGIRLIYEIYKSSFIHILRIIKKDENPSIVEIQLSVDNPYIITIISNAITLTPGTITVDVQGNKLYVLTIKGQDNNHQDLQEEIKRKFEGPFIEGGKNR